MELKKLINLLDKNGQLVKINRPVCTKYEIASIIKLLKGRPVLFASVSGYTMPVVSNICGSKELVCLGLGIEREDLINRLSESVESPKDPKVESPKGYQKLPPDLSKLPILTYYPQDGGPYIASGIVIGKDPEYGLNASYHRAMVIGKDKLVFRIVKRHLHAFIERGMKEFSFCIGNSIPVLLGAALSVEMGKNEIAIANALCETKLLSMERHLVPKSEIILICEFTGEYADEGPFLDLTETFDIVRKQRVARIKKMWIRENALYHALLPGDVEHKILMGMPREPTIFREVSKVCQCLDVRLTEGGCSWLHGVIKIRKCSPDDGVNAIDAAFNGHPSMKHVFVVDEDIDIQNQEEIEWAMATRFQGHKDIVLRKDQKGSSLDPSSDLDNNRTTKLGFDLTIPSGEPHHKFQRAAVPMKIKLEEYMKRK